MTRTGVALGCLVVALGLGAPAHGQPGPAPGPSGDPSPGLTLGADPPCDARDPLRQPFFGDLHVHTSFSFDANALGVRTTPRDAYRVAKGERLGLQPVDSDGRARRSAWLDRPLDFAAVTDHAELLGEVQVC